MPAPAPHVARLLDDLARTPGAPRITWYGDDGERIELSGAVLGNWVSKSTNLLVEELDAAPGSRVALDLPAHWRSLVWALAAWRCGATLVTSTNAAIGSDGSDGSDDRSHVDVAVTSQPSAWAQRADEIVAVALPALARRFDGELPAGALDAASAVMTYGDQLGWVPAVDLGGDALEATAGPGVRDVVGHGDLVSTAARTAGSPEGARVLLDAGAAPLGETLLTVVGVLAGDGSVVLVSPGTAAELRADDVRRARVVAGERVTLDRL